MTAIRYPSSDGLEIPAYLTLPKGVPAKNLPLVVVPHGGPWARDVWGYDPLSQFLANRGYAVLQPNFRGSTGFGKRFLDAGNRQWGDRMQDDITWGVKYLVARGTVDAKRVGILGGSYGGYATLAGVAFTPDVYAAAVSIVGPSNLLTLLNSIPPYWEAGRKVFHERMGDPNTPEGKTQLERQSPLNSASKIRTPLMVVQGANDPRVNKRESDQIVVALRDRKFPVEYLVAPDEGHGFANPVNNMAAFAAAERFLAKYLGGRFQETMPPEVAARLGKIRVDPRTLRATEPDGAIADAQAGRAAGARDVHLPRGHRARRAVTRDVGDHRHQRRRRGLDDHRYGDHAGVGRQPGRHRGGPRASWTRRRCCSGSARSRRGSNQIEYVVAGGKVVGAVPRRRADSAVQRRHRRRPVQRRGGAVPVDCDAAVRARLQDRVPYVRRPGAACADASGSRCSARSR